MLFALLCLPGFGCAGGVSSGKITPADLQCEWTQNPLGVDIVQPRLSWSIQSDTRDQFQTAFQILAASSTELLAGAQVIYGTAACLPAMKQSRFSMTANR